MADPFTGQTPTLHSPGSAFAAVTPNDSADLAVQPRFLIVGVGGTISCNDARGVTTSITVTAGVIPIRPIRILATGTTATGIVACW